MKKIRSKWMKRLIAPLLAALLFVSLQGNVKAAEYQCEISIPVSVNITGNTEEAPETSFDVVMEPITEEASQTSITVAGNTSGSFDPRTYNAPGDYVYKVYQEAGTDKYFTYDSSIYEVTVRVTNAEDGGLEAFIWAVKDDSDQKVDKIEFNNRYNKKTVTPTTEKKTTTKRTVKASVGRASKKVKTGDDSNPLLWSCVAAVSVICIALFLLAGRKRRNDYR